MTLCRPHRDPHKPFSDTSLCRGMKSPSTTSIVHQLCQHSDVSPENDGRPYLEHTDGFGGPYERSGPMKRSKCSEEQVVYALRQAEGGIRSAPLPAAGSPVTPRSMRGKRSTPT